MNHFNVTHYAKNQIGSVAVETALLLPLVITLFAGVFESGRLMVLSQKILHASYNAADMLTRDEVITDSEIDDAFALVRLSIEPFDVREERVDMNVASITYSAADNPQQIWQKNAKSGGDLDNDLVNEAEGLGLAGEGYLIVKVRYAYQPFVFSNFRFFTDAPLFTDLELAASYVLKGRVSECISYDTEGMKNDAIC